MFGAPATAMPVAVRQPVPPRFPAELFARLARLAPRSEIAWDAATGQGAVASNLVQFFRRVIASDARHEVVAQAAVHPRISYVIARAEECGLASGSIDLVVVAQSLHFLDTDSFYPEVQRVLRPGGVIAAWCYGDCVVAARVDSELKQLRAELTGFWGSERDLVASGYLMIPFPFEEIDMPPQFLKASWTLEDMLSHLRTWQGVRAYKALHSQDDLERLLTPVAQAWGTPTFTRDVTWPIHTRIGRSVL
jgi:SAM-dependent methyltransferase